MVGVRASKNWQPLALARCFRHFRPVRRASSEVNFLTIIVHRPDLQARLVWLRQCLQPDATSKLIDFT